MNKEIRVRFAPSPTGYLHLGGIRTALYNWLFARHSHGKFLIRIEDTDRSRYVKGAEDECLRTLEKLGLRWDEHLIRQSNRLELYRKHVDQLLNDDLAYCDDLGGVKFRLPNESKFVLEDVLHGKTTFNVDKMEDFEDFVILRTSGFPLYNFACVVDDVAMEITHVIRGNEHISNTLKQILLYEALGWKKPFFAHLPTIVVGKDGKKLAKRHGALTVDMYFKMGYLPEAIRNYVTLLGWSPGNDREIISLEESVELFDLNKVSRHNAVFDAKKMEWMNSQYISRTDDTELVNILRSHQNEIDREQLPEVVRLYKSRAKSLNDFVEWTGYLRGETKYEESAKDEVLSRKDTVSILEAVKETLEALSQFDPESIQKSLRNIDKDQILEPLFSINELLSKEDAVLILESVREALEALDPFDREKIEESLRSIDKEQILELLYSADSEFQRELNNGVIPEILRQKFGDNEMELLQEAVVLTKDLNRWQIEDGFKIYQIKREAGKLHVYRLRFRDVAQAVRVAITGDTVSPGIFETLALVGKSEVLGKIQKCINYCRTTQHSST
ncbi:glutamate--tRNA ligase [Candidatus Poribacteria bacterium]